MNDTFDPGRAEELAARLERLGEFLGRKVVGSQSTRSAAEMLRAAVAMIAGIREEHAKVLACADAHQSMLTQTCRDRDRLAARVAELESFARDCANNWDCDSDAHKYNTGCRSCAAQALLGGK
jgi:hypothetical protein